MRTRPRAATLGLALLAAATTGCGTADDVPDRPPDVTGRVALADEPGSAALADPSDPYYEGMHLLRGNPVLVRSSDGAAVPYEVLEDGDEVEVWIGGPCAESFPVQCEVAALRVDG